MVPGGGGVGSRVAPLAGSRAAAASARVGSIRSRGRGSLTGGHARPIALVMFTNAGVIACTQLNNTRANVARAQCRAAATVSVNAFAPPPA